MALFCVRFRYCRERSKGLPTAPFVYMAMEISARNRKRAVCMAITAIHVHYPKMFIEILELSEVRDMKAEWLPDA